MVSVVKASSLPVLRKITKGFMSDSSNKLGSSNNKKAK